MQLFDMLNILSEFFKLTLPHTSHTTYIYYLDQFSQYQNLITI